MLYVLAALALTALLWIICLLVPLPMKLSQYSYTSIHIPKALDGFCLVQVSDLHDHCFGREQEKLLAAIAVCKPQLIVITGDLFDRHKEGAEKNALNFCKQAVKLAPVLFAEGNHETALTSCEEKLQKLRTLGVRVLQNEGCSISFHGSELNVVGLKERFTTDELRSLLNPTGFTLVLSHRPECLPQYVAAGAKLVLCGHAHGGQVRLFGRGLYAPEQGLFPKYTKGCYREGDTTMLVSCGLGNTVAVPRIHDPAELIQLTLRHTTGSN